MPGSPGTEATACLSHCSALAVFLPWAGKKTACLAQRTRASDVLLGDGFKMWMAVSLALAFSLLQVFG